MKRYTPVIYTPETRVLVTGGAGFLGSHLCECLLNDGYYVLCIDNLSTGSMENINHLLGNKNFKFIEHDITKPLHADVKHIYNFACPASPVNYQADPVKTWKTSALGVLNMLELAYKTSARLLQASTSEVYGTVQVHPQSEGYWGHVNPIGVRACYDEGKRAAEALIFDYHRQYNVDVKVVRIFNTYGPRMHPEDGRVVSNFITQALQGADITVYGDGTQTRSFCYVSCLIVGIMLMMKSREGFIGPVNLGNDWEFTIAELAEKVITMIGSKSKIIHLPLPQDDPPQRRPSLDLAKKELRWAPKIDLDEGLGKTIDYYKNYGKNTV